MYVYEIHDLLTRLDRAYGRARDDLGRQREHVSSDAAALKVEYETAILSLLASGGPETLKKLDTVFSRFGEKNSIVAAIQESENRRNAAASAFADLLKKYPACKSVQDVQNLILQGIEQSLLAKKNLEQASEEFSFSDKKLKPIRDHNESYYNRSCVISVENADDILADKSWKRWFLDPAFRRARGHLKALPLYKTYVAEHARAKDKMDAATTASAEAESVLQQLYADVHDYDRVARAMQGRDVNIPATVCKYLDASLQKNGAADVFAGLLPADRRAPFLTTVVKYQNMKKLEAFLEAQHAAILKAKRKIADPIENLGRAASRNRYAQPRTSINRADIEKTIETLPAGVAAIVEKAEALRKTTVAFQLPSGVTPAKLNTRLDFGRVTAAESGVSSSAEANDDSFLTTALIFGLFYQTMLADSANSAGSSQDMSFSLGVLQPDMGDLAKISADVQVSFPDVASGLSLDTLAGQFAAAGNGLSDISFDVSVPEVSVPDTSWSVPDTSSWSSGSSDMGSSFSFDP